MMDYLNLYRSELEALCMPGETPIALNAVMYMQGKEEVGNMSSITFDPINGLDVSRWNDAADKFVGGTSLIAPNGGMALGMHRVLDGSMELMLTNLRLVLIKGTLGSPKGLQVVWACNLNDVANIQHQPRLTQRGRLLIQFVDGSAIRLMAGFISGKKARAFAYSFRVGRSR